MLYLNQILPPFLFLFLLSFNPLIYFVNAATPTSGCGLPIPTEVTAGGRSYNFTHFLSNSTTHPSYRAYSLTVPRDYDINSPAPLILSFHGRTKNNLNQLQLSKFSNPFFNTKAIVAYPQGIDVPPPLSPLPLFFLILAPKLIPPQGQWLGDPDAPPSINDTLFISELLTHLQSRFCISPLQIFASGKSNGGGLVGRLACNPEMSSRIAAFAPVSGAFYRDFMGPCYPSRSPIPMLEFHGGADKTICYGGGEGKKHRGVTVPIPSWLHNWTIRDGCANNAKNSTVVLPGVGGKSVQRTTWDCKGRSGIVSHYFSKALGHKWPTEGNAGYNATSVILDFFYGHPLPAAVEENVARSIGRDLR